MPRYSHLHTCTNASCGICISCCAFEFQALRGNPCTLIEPYFFHLRWKPQAMGSYFSVGVRVCQLVLSLQPITARAPRDKRRFKPELSSDLVRRNVPGKDSASPCVPACRVLLGLLSLRSPVTCGRFTAKGLTVPSSASKPSTDRCSYFCSDRAILLCQVLKTSAPCHPTVCAMLRLTAVVFFPEEPMLLNSSSLIKQMQAV